MAAPFSSNGRMDEWPERVTMNLRSVFTPEQLRVLERYYESGMTNQSKACFQLILQCAQETKLDFSVVRTWVGNKRRKLASKAEQNGGVPHTMSSHGPVGVLLSNHTLAGGALSNHGLAGGSLVAGAMMTAEITAVRSIQNRGPLLPPSSTFPSSSSSSSPSSSSPRIGGSSNNNNNNNDVILTGIYSVNPAPRIRPRPPTLPSHPDTEPSPHSKPSLPNLAVHGRTHPSSSPLPSRHAASLPSKAPPHSSPTGPSAYTSARKGAVSLPKASVGTGTGSALVFNNWARQQSAAQTRPVSSSFQSQHQSPPGANSGPRPQPLPLPRARVVPPTQKSASSSEQTPRIQEVFTLSGGAAERGGLQSFQSISSRRGQENHRPVPRAPDTSGYFSIAMETADEEDEWQREEQLAVMAAQSHTHMEQSPTSPCNVEIIAFKRSDPSPIPHCRPPPHQSSTVSDGSYNVTRQTSLTGESGLQTSVSGSAAPWLLSNSRKRTLQDRTQFSDADLVQLKRFWNRGMTSLGFVCREKITAAANQLNVDTEIVKTWISNRRRKYRLMGIDIPPPTDGPALFASSPGNESPSALVLDEEGLRTPELGDELNDTGSLCLSEDGMNDSCATDGDDGKDVLNAVSLANNVKIEIIDEDEDDVREMMPSDMEQMQNLLEFKHEEVQFLESELANQKQKYHKLEAFTKSLLTAIKNQDLKKQQELLASLPQPEEEEVEIWNEMPVDEEGPAGMLIEASPGQDEPSIIIASDEGPPSIPATEGFPLVTLNEDGLTTDVTEPSASEEQLEESVTDKRRLFDT